MVFRRLFQVNTQTSRSLEELVARGAVVMAFGEFVMLEEKCQPGRKS